MSDRHGDGTAEEGNEREGDGTRGEGPDDRSVPDGAGVNSEDTMNEQQNETEPVRPQVEKVDIARILGRQPAARAADGLEGYEDDLRRAERKVAGEIDPGMRALVVAVAVLVAMVSLVLPHTGSASGIDVLAQSADSAAERVAITSKVFVWLLVVFGIGASTLALLTRRWIIAWIALCGSAVSCVAGVLAWWSRNTPGVGGVTPPTGVGAGLILGLIAAFVLTFHWARVVWARSTYHLAVEEARRREAAARDAASRELQHKSSLQEHENESPDDPTDSPDDPGAARG